MELSATFLFKVICNGEETAGFEIFQDPGIIDKCELVSWKRFQDLGTYIGPVNRIYRRFMNSKRLPIRACRLVSSTLLSAVPMDNRFIQSLKGRLTEFINNRKTITPACFRSLLKDYEFLIDPFDILRGSKDIKLLSMFGYELKYLYVACVFVGYERADAQNVVDMVYDTADSFSPILQVRNFCLTGLQNICGLHHLPPTAMLIELPNVLVDRPYCGGGSADVYKCNDLAVKVLRTGSNDNQQKVIRKFYREVITWNFLRHDNILPFLGVPKDSFAFAMVSKWMANGTINNYVRGRPNVNRFELLTEVANGLIYMHGQRVIHGDLKGENILIDDVGNARIADFGLVSIQDSDSSNGAGTCRWMGPEIINPEMLGLHEVFHTESSDCYAFGMMIYEVLSGRVPFYSYISTVVKAKILRGERPERPQTVASQWFTDDIWRLLEGCWRHLPSDRPNVNHVLECLGRASGTWTPFPTPEYDPQDGDFVEDTGT